MKPEGTWLHDTQPISATPIVTTPANSAGRASVRSLARLFQPMVRGEGGALQRNVGLGLFIVSELARAHGGGVAVESNPLAGTRFSFEFPQARAPVPVA